MDSTEAATAKIIISELTKVGIINPFLIAGILAVIYKESGFVPKSELSYKNTKNNAYIRSIFSAFKNVSDADIEAIKKNDTVFFDFVYGRRYGNNLPGDGLKYRGRGFNQITFKDLYKKYGDEIGQDLINHPDLLNDPSIAAAAAAHYFLDTINSGLKNSKLASLFHVHSLSDINSYDLGLLVAFQANAGLNTNLNTAFFKQSIADTKKTLKEFISPGGLSPIIPIIATGLLILLFTKINT